MGKAHGFPIKREKIKKIKTKDNPNFQEETEFIGEIHLVNKDSVGNVKEDWRTKDKKGG
jgi:hypothetical protein